MVGSRARWLAAVGLAATLGVTAPAIASAPPRVDRDLSLQTETTKQPVTGVMLKFVTTRKAAKVRVRIDGYSAHVTPDWTRRVIAFAGKQDNGLRPGHFKIGRHYRVDITLCSATGACKRVTKRLALSKLERS